MRLREVVAECWAITRTSRVASLLVGAVVAGTCFVAIATVGQTSASAAHVAERLDRAGVRILTVVDSRGTGVINRATLTVVSSMESVSYANALSAPIDTVNGATGLGGPRVPMWSLLQPPGEGIRLLAGRLPQPGEAILSAPAQAVLGLEAPAGFLTSVDGQRQFPIVDTYSPGPALAVGVLGMLAALLAAVPPALLAARLDPVRILRVP